MPEERVLVLPNGAYMSRFKDAIEVPESVSEEWADAYNFIYSSSPDRGLHHVLKLWPHIRDMMMGETGAECYLHVCYGIENFVGNSRWSHREDGNRALTIEELIGQDGIIYHGKIGQDALAALMLNCDLMLYPADTMSPTETGCISIVEALAAGCNVVTTDCDCIGPDYAHVTAQTPLPFDDRKYLALILDALDPEDYEAVAEAGREFALTRDWPVIAEQWVHEFSEIIEGVKA
jgi:glycosyltransferase involved in cell wall biosynthesis